MSCWPVWDVMHVSLSWDVLARQSGPFLFSLWWCIDPDAVYARGSSICFSQNVANFLEPSSTTSTALSRFSQSNSTPTFLHDHRMQVFKRMSGWPIRDVMYVSLSWDILASQSSPSLWWCVLYSRSDLRSDLIGPDTVYVRVGFGISLIQNMAHFLEPGSSSRATDTRFTQSDSTPTFFNNHLLQLL